MERSPPWVYRKTWTSKAIIFLFMWVRWSLPRFRFDQIMNLAWRAMIPMALVMLLVTATTLYLFGPHDEAFRATGLITWKMAVALLIANAVMLVIIAAGAALLPAAPPTNRRVRVLGSRFDQAPAAVPATA